MAEPLLTKDAVNIGGHKLPLPVVGAVVGVLGLLFILRARSRGSNVASAGMQPSPASSDLSGGVLGLGQEAQLSNLSSQLTALQQSLNPAPVTAPGPPAAVPAPPAPPPSDSRLVHLNINPPRYTPLPFPTYWSQHGMANQNPTIIVGYR